MKETSSIRGWIYYDALCPICVRGRALTERLFESRHFRWVPLQSVGAAEQLGIDPSELETRMHLLDAHGIVRRDSDALAELLRSVWWLWPAGALLSFPGIRPLARLGYHALARNRYCLGGACSSRPQWMDHLGWVDWLTAAAVPVLLGWFASEAPRWVFMWAMALGLGESAKWLAWRDARIHDAHPSPFRTLAWFLFWPGLDGRAFLGANCPVPECSARHWSVGAANCLLGAALCWGVFPVLYGRSPRAAAWIGMVGIVFCLHFGFIRLLSLVFQHNGVNAQPIMHAPILSKSLSEFWGRRWNTAFSVAAHRLLFVPARRYLGPAPASFLVFFASGLLHEIVLSLPARGGFGLPIAYFLVQWMGLTIERSRWGRHLGLGRGKLGWLLAFVGTAGPVLFLFHEPFLHRVMIPFLTWITNTSP